MEGEHRPPRQGLVHAGAQRRDLTDERIAVAERIVEAPPEARDARIERGVGREVAGEDQRLRAGADRRPAAAHQDFARGGRWQVDPANLDPALRDVEQGVGAHA